MFALCNWSVLTRCRLNDTRAQKVKYSRLAREKEEEIGMYVCVCECVSVSECVSV